MYQDAKVWRLCRYRHKRHSFISALAQTQTPDATIRHQRSPQSEILEQYSHVRLEAKRRAVESLNSLTGQALQ
jgi:hypothetical protein